jgi:hypothetical protein
MAGLLLGDNYRIIPKKEYRDFTNYNRLQAYIKSSHESLRGRGFTITTNDAFIESGRRVGNTYRQVDYAIQALFSGAFVKVIDHADTKGNSTRLLMHNIKRRLEVEHDLTRMYDKGYINLTRDTMVLTEKYWEDRKKFEDKYPEAKREYDTPYFT